MAAETTKDYQSLSIPETGKWSNPNICGCLASTRGCKGCCMGVCWACCGPCLYPRIAARIQWPNSYEFLGSTMFQRWFRLTLGLVIVYWIAGWIESLLTPDPRADLDAADFTAGNFTSFVEKPQRSTASQAFSTIQSICGIVWLVMVVQLRAGMRKKYQIPATCCATGDVCCNVDCEDVLCGCCCTSCTLSQMAQHTEALDDAPCNCCDCTDPGPCQEPKSPDAAATAEEKAPTGSNSMV